MNPDEVWYLDWKVNRHFDDLINKRLTNEEYKFIRSKNIDINTVSKDAQKLKDWFNTGMKAYNENLDKYMEYYKNRAVIDIQQLPEHVRQ